MQRIMLAGIILAFGIPAAAADQPRSGSSLTPTGVSGPKVPQEITDAIVTIDQQWVVPEQNGLTSDEALSTSYRDLLEEFKIRTINELRNVQNSIDRSRGTNVNVTTIFGQAVATDQSPFLMRYPFDARAEEIVTEFQDGHLSRADLLLDKGLPIGHELRKFEHRLEGLAETLSESLPATRPTAYYFDSFKRNRKREQVESVKGVVRTFVWNCQFNVKWPSGKSIRWPTELTLQLPDYP